jgi:hypothetical protein
MIFIDIDGVCVDFYGTAKKFGIELELNKFGYWKWGVDGYPAAEEFYKAACPQPWLKELLHTLVENRNRIIFITKDFSKPKRQFLKRVLRLPDSLMLEAADGKAAYCMRPLDFLLDDNLAECEAWRKKGGIAYWLNLAEQDPFGKFLKWWGME